MSKRNLWLLNISTTLFLSCGLTLAGELPAGDITQVVNGVNHCAQTLDPSTSHQKECHPQEQPLSPSPEKVCEPSKPYQVPKLGAQEATKLRAYLDEIAKGQYFETYRYSALVKQAKERLSETKLDGKSRQQYSRLSNDELAVIFAYTGGLFSRLNPKLRTGEDIRGTSEENAVFWLMQAIKKTPQFSGVVQRCVNLPDTILGAYLETGNCISDGGFVSTSSSKEWGKKCNSPQLLEIEVCSGAQIDAIAYLPGEKEVLLPPGSSFRVTHVEKRKKLDSQTGASSELSWIKLRQICK